jgi:hypothetical protein
MFDGVEIHNHEEFEIFKLSLMGEEVSENMDINVKLKINLQEYLFLRENYIIIMVEDENITRLRG